MKNYLKKLIIMFVMAFSVISVGIIQNGVIANAATVGQKLTQPEEGWRRYDDTNNNIVYNGIGWSRETLDGEYNTTLTFVGGGTSQANMNTCKVSLKFYGTKFRLINSLYDDYATLAIKIDGTIMATPNTKSTCVRQVLECDIQNLTLGDHTVEIYSTTNGRWDFDGIDIDDTGYLLQSNTKTSTISLNKSSIDLTKGTTDQLTATVTTSTAIGVTWKSSDESVATVDNNGKVTAIKEGKATITATTTDEYKIGASCVVTVTPQTTSSAVILNIEPEKTNIHINEIVTANLTIDNIKEIAAEDIRIKYDNTRLKFLGMDEVDGIKLVKSEGKDGELRLILASKGVANVIQAKKALLKLNFQGIAKGEALVDVTKGRVSDGMQMEKDLTDAECGQATITIDDTVLKDVNNSGEFTLLDLAIDSRHLGEDPVKLTEYNTDQVINGAIDDEDLTQIGKYMLENGKYSFN